MTFLHPAPALPTEVRAKETQDTAANDSEQDGYRGKHRGGDIPYEHSSGTTM